MLDFFEGLTAREGLAFAFMAIGTFFMTVSGIGILRLPDLFLRMSMTTKSSTLGVGSMMVAAVILFEGNAASVQAVAIIFFLLLTAPVSAHMIGRAGYGADDMSLWERTRVDDLEGRYDEDKHTLSSHLQQKLKDDADAKPLYKKD